MSVSPPLPAAVAANPYSPPLSELGMARPRGCRRDGKAVIVPAGHDLPPRCIRCNAPVGGRIKPRTLYWHSPWWYLLILVHILVYVIVGLIVRRSVAVSPALCGEHAAQRARWLWGGVVVALAAMVGCVVTAANGNAVAGVLLGVVALVVLLVTARVTKMLRPTRIDAEAARLVGCREPFLASLARD